MLDISKLSKLKIVSFNDWSTAVLTVLADSSRWLVRLLIVVAGLALAACASVPSSSDVTDVALDDAVIEPSADQVAITPDQALALDPDLPQLELDTGTLEQLLVMNFASYQNDWSQAADSALSAATSSQDYRLARFATLAALRGNDYQKSALSALLWVSLKGESEDAKNMLLISQVGAGQTEQALRSIERYREDTSLDEYIKQVAGLLVRQRNGSAAHDVVTDLVSQYPDSAQVMLSSAFVAQTFEHYDSATQWVDSALQLRPEWELAAQTKADLLRAQGKNDERSDFIAQYVKAYPESVVMRINYAADLAREEKFELAYQVMQQTLADAPLNVPALRYTAALAEQLEDDDEAAKYYRRALRQEPQNDEVRWSWARIEAAKENYATAERLYNDISDQDLYVSAQMQVATMQYHLEGVAVAVNTLRALEPNTTNEYIDIAITRHYLLMQAKEYDEALGYVNETLIYLPDNLDLLYARALVAAELKKIDIAEGDFRAILAQQPDHANALNAFGYTLADQTERYEEARELIAKALELRPNDAHILDSMGWVLYRLQDLDKAVEFLEKAFEASPEVEIAAHLGEVLWEAGEREKANLVWQQSYNKDDENRTLNETLERYGVALVRQTTNQSAQD